MFVCLETLGSRCVIGTGCSLSRPLFANRLDNSGQKLPVLCVDLGQIHGEGFSVLLAEVTTTQRIFITKTIIIL